MEGRARLSLLHVVAAAALVVLLQLHGGAVVVASEPPYTCGAGAPPNIPFCDAGLPIDRRVDDLVSRMTVAKKTSQLGDQSPAIPRLGVPAYKWWSEALHGISNQGRGIHLDGPLRAATSFPQVILTAASFNPHLWYRIGQVRTHTASRLWLSRSVANAHDLPLSCSCYATSRITTTAQLLYWQ